jgi:hypothetical protein
MATSVRRAINEDTMMDVLLNLIFVLGTWLLLFAFPGALWASRLTHQFWDASAKVSLALTLGFATFVVPSVVFLVAAVLKQPIGIGLTALSSALLVASQSAEIKPVFKRLAELRGPGAWWKKTRGHRVLLFAVGVAFLYQLLFFDSFFHFQCTYKPVGLAAGLGIPVGSGGENLSFWYQGHQRWGISAILSPSFSLYGFIGLRLLWAAIFAFIPLGTYIVARRSGLLRGSACCSALVAALLPAVAGGADQNRIVLALIVFVALLMALRVYAPFWIGLATGLVFAGEPVAVLGLLALVLARRNLPHQGNHAEAKRWILLGLLVAVIPVFLRYKLAYGSLLYHEHFSYIPELPYSFLGMDFSFSGFLNWPLNGELVRSPYNAYPNLVILPLSVVEHFGFLLFGLAMVGLLAMRKEAQNIFRLSMVFGLPIVLFLALNENWIEKDKWEIVIMTYLPLYLAVGFGVHWFFSRKNALRAVGGLGLTFLLIFGARDLALSVDAPADQRLYDVYAAKGAPLLDEDGAYIELERFTFQDLDWLPSHHRQVKKRLQSKLDPHPMLRRVQALRDELQELHPTHRLGKRVDFEANGLPEFSLVPFDISVPPHNGLDPEIRKPAGRSGCNPGATFTTIEADAAAQAIEVIWNDQPLMVSLRTDPEQKLALLELERRSRTLPSDPISKQCLHLMVPSGFALLVDDRVSIEPSRVYTYQYSEALKYPGWFRLTLLGE